MKATITLHKNPSIVEIVINRVFFGCKTEYIVPEATPKPDPMEGMTDEQKVEYLKKENKILKRKLCDAARKENEYEARLLINKVKAAKST
jgi:hypothetical protein